MIERTYTWSRRFFISVFALAGGSLLYSVVLPPAAGGDFFGDLHFLVVACSIALAITCFAPLHFHGNILKKRKQAIATDPRIAALGLNKESMPPEKTTNFLAIATRDAKFHSVIGTGDWRYGDHTHAIYKKMKNGEYKAATVYYSVLELSLPRKLPNLLFDSQKSHKKQYSVLFDRSQRHSLEGNFDQHFTTYFPKFYTIDALAIISPEVMHAMIMADQFDIEIEGDKLYLFGPLIPVDQIPAMVEKGKLIRQKLLNNIVTYRDERVAGTKGRQTVSTFGARLRENPYRGWPLILLGLGLLGGSIYVTLTGDAPEDVFEGFLYGIAIIGATVYDIRRKLAKNRKLDKAYMSLASKK